MASPFLSRSARLRRSHRSLQFPAAGRSTASPRPTPLEPPAVLELVQYEITTESMRDPILEKLSPADQDRILDVGAEVMDGSRVQIPVLEALVREFPDQPKVYNFLCIAFQNGGRMREAREWAEKTYLRFPGYLFGVVNHARFLLHEGRVAEVTALLDRRFALHLWCPGRRRFHITEFVAFQSLMVHYWHALGEAGAARKYLNMLNKVAPNHPQTAGLNSLLRPNPLRSFLRSLRAGR